MGRSSSGSIWCIVLAAGGGSRFGAAKQFATAAGRRLVDLAVEVAQVACEHVVLVLPAGQEWTGSAVTTIVEGGQDRGSSVRAALEAIPDESGVVVVHQAANPLASSQTVRSLVEAVENGAEAVFPGLRPTDLVRRTVGDRAGAVVGRDELVLVQTPAAFRLEVLRAAHALDMTAIEDTTLVSAAGHEVHVLPGDPRNVHVVTPADLRLVEDLLRVHER